jgi:hypothetical protein
MGFTFTQSVSPKPFTCTTLVVTRLSQINNLVTTRKATIDV